jgi:hypothetical protein
MHITFARLVSGVALICAPATHALHAQTASTARPAVLFIDVISGPRSGGPNNLGVPIAIFGTGFGATRGASTVTINSSEVASYLSWGVRNANNTLLDMLVVQPGPAVTAGPIVVTIGGQASNTTHIFTPTNGAIYVIAPEGADSAACTLAQPCATILHTAGDVMKPGDALLVRGGAINDDEIWIRDALGHSGWLTQTKTIRNYPSETPVFTKFSRPFILDANYMTVSGLHFIGGKPIVVGGDVNPSGHGNRVINNAFSGAISYDAIGTHGDDHVLAGNTCNVEPSTVGTQGHCYYISNGSGVRLLYNVARGASGYGIHIFDQKRSDNDYQRVISNIVIEGNLLATSIERSGLIIAMADEGGKGNYIDTVLVRNNLFVANNFAGIAIGGVTRNVRIEHNTFYANGRQGITIYDEATVNGVSIVNNLIDQTPNSNCKSNCAWYPLAHIQRGAAAQNVIASHNVYAPGPAPLFFNISDSAPINTPAGFVPGLPATDNFHLQSNSAAIDAGRTLTSTLTDFDGQTRMTGAAPDIGAYEYLGAGAIATATSPAGRPRRTFLPVLRRLGLQ